MANTLDLQEQEQLDEIKAFWSKYGNLITWFLTLCLLAYAGWNGWNWWQREQAAKAGAMFEELDKAIQSRDVDRAGRIFGDLKERYARTVFAEEGGLMVAQQQFDAGQLDAAKASFGWVAENAREDEYRAIARLRLAGVLLDGKLYDEALKQLDGIKSPAFAALAADRRGDVLLAQGKRDDAKAAYALAYHAMDERLDYRRLLEAKLTALGAPPAPAAPAALSGAGR